MTNLWIALAAATLVFATASLGPLPSNGAATLAARTSDAGGVKVVVTPRALDPDSKTWEFEIVMDTHTKPLKEDLVQVAVLVDDAGRRYAPVSWQGDAPGAHHRKGTLHFTAPTEMPVTVELRINDVGGVAVRTFRWELK
jgi:hypothetical protein